MPPEPRLRAQGIVLRPGALAISDIVGAGEIVGLAGLDGHGQEDFLAVLAGVRRPAAGRVAAAWHGQEWPLGERTQAARHGIVYLPRDRRTTGVFAPLSVIDNFAIAAPQRDSRFGLIGAARRRRRFAAFRSLLSVVAASDSLPISALSGGNQQKVLLARMLALDPRVLLLDDPTRGVDVRTRLTLYGVFRDLAARGMALVLVSTEIEELQHLCSRVLVFREGGVAARLAGAEIGGDRILAAMFGRAA